MPGAVASAAPVVRVFISYAHESEAHAEAVRDLWVFLRANGVDAKLDRVAAQRRLDWTLWMEKQVEEADHILVIASPAYKRRAGHRAEPDEGRGVQYEARLIRDRFYKDQGALQRFLPVVLPGDSPDDLPTFLTSTIATWYRVSAFTVAGAEPLLRVLTRQPEEVEPPLGPKPVLSTREHHGLPRRPALRHDVRVEVAATPWWGTDDEHLPGGHPARAALRADTGGAGALLAGTRRSLGHGPVGRVGPGPVAGDVRRTDDPAPARPHRPVGDRHRGGHGGATGRRRRGTAGGTAAVPGRPAHGHRTGSSGDPAASRNRAVANTGVTGTGENP
ncbi:MAG: SEFIR domain-containing protein, partial [Sciscionella sp.]